MEKILAKFTACLWDLSSYFLHLLSISSVQAVPIPTSKAAAVQDIFNLAAEKLGFKFLATKCEFHFIIFSMYSIFLMLTLLWIVTWMLQVFHFHEFCVTYCLFVTDNQTWEVMEAWNVLQAQSIFSYFSFFPGSVLSMWPWPIRNCSACSNLLSSIWCILNFYMHLCSFFFFGQRVKVLMVEDHWGHSLTGTVVSFTWSSQKVQYCHI